MKKVYRFGWPTCLTKLHFCLGALQRFLPTCLIRTIIFHVPRLFSITSFRNVIPHYLFYQEANRILTIPFILYPLLICRYFQGSEKIFEKGQNLDSKYRGRTSTPVLSTKMRSYCFVSSP